MKLIYHPNPTHTFIMEGSIEEIYRLLGLLINESPKGSSKMTSKRPDVQVIKPREMPDPLTMTDDFLESIYMYEPNPAADSGRGAYIAQQILRGGSQNISRLATKSRGSRSTVMNAIRRMQEAGAVLEVSKSSVKLLSVPEGPYQARSYRHGAKVRRVKASPKPAVTSTSTPSVPTVSSSSSLLDSLSSIKLA